MTCSGKFRTHSTQIVDSASDALRLVEEHAAANSLTGVKRVQDPEFEDCVRYTATTPGGRHGRNIAFLESL
jgi:hypothetical protein